MSKRGRRRHSKRRKSSSSSKQSVSPYIFQKPDNKKNSIGYRDDIAEKGERDCLKKEHVLYASEDEEKDNGPPKEKRLKEDFPDNSKYTQNEIYTKTTENLEKGVRITTSVSVSDINESFHKVLFQQSHELFCKTSSITAPNFMKINYFGPSVELEIHERLQKDTSGIKTTFVLRGGNEGRAEMVYQSECEKGRMFSSYSAHVATDPPKPPVQVSVEPQPAGMSSHGSFSRDFCEISPPREFADVEHESLEQLTSDLASCRIGSCHLVQDDPCQLDRSGPENSTCRYLGQTEETKDRGSSYYELSESDKLGPFYTRPSLSTNRSSFTKDFINCQRKKSCLRNNSIGTIEHRACLFPNKRRQTFPGQPQGPGGQIEDDPLLTHTDLFSSFFKREPLFQNQLLEEIDWDEKFGPGSFTQSSSTQSFEIPDTLDGKELTDSHFQTASVGGPNIVPAVHVPQLRRRSNGQPNGEQKPLSQATNCCQCGSDPPRAADRGFHQEMGEIEYFCTDRFAEEPRQTNLPSSCCSSLEHEYQNNTLESANQWDSLSLPQTRSEVGARDEERGPTYSLDDQTEPLCSAPVEASVRSPLQGSAAHPLNTDDITDPSKPKPAEEKTENPFLASMTDETNRVHLDTSSCEQENQSFATCAEESRDKREKSGKAIAFRSSLKSKEQLTLKVHEESDASSSDHWAKRRKLFRESKQWSSAGVSSFTSDVTEESVSEEVNPVNTVQTNHDCGFYTETFHSSAWMFRGDDGQPDAVPSSLATRARPVSIRDRTVKIDKGTGEYPWGLRLQFSKPIVVTEVDTNGAAEEAGLIVGDYVLAVNGIDVTDIPHSEAADLARQGPDVLTLTIGSDIARVPNIPRPACRGYLYKRTQSGLIKGWRKRWFVLKHNCCLYYFRHKRDEGKRQAVSAIKLDGAEVGPDTSLGKPFVFKCRPQSGHRVYFFCATSNQEMKRWLEAMGKAIHPIVQNHVWVDVTRHNANLPPLAVQNPDCLGLLHKMDKIRDMWVQHYCILKDGCLYLYSGIRATHAHGGIYLQGYVVREQPYGSKKSTIELKPPSDEFKTFHLCAENPAENKRWIVVIQASIKKWLPLHQALQAYMSQPLEETRM